ncbi:MAG TPA: hypothetical protein VF510_22005 [Ktedonobacterales bacterium]
MLQIRHQRLTRYDSLRFTLRPAKQEKHKWHEVIGEIGCRRARNPLPSEVNSAIEAHWFSSGVPLI